MIKQITFFTILISLLFSQTNLSGLSNSELDLLRQELGPVDASNTSNLMIKDSDETLGQEIISIDAISKNDEPDSYYFGYEYFEKDIDFTNNTPTPNDYILGPGDEIILSLWGETNSRQKFILSREGLIYYEKVGPINLSGRSIQQAESFLINKLSEVYSTLKDKNNSTDLKIELGSLKSINIYFSGEFSKPGISPVYPFVDILTAVIQAGGVNREASLRNIQIIRDGKLIHTVDFYNFFNKGDAKFFDIKLLNRDIIYIPRVDIRANIQGAINRPGYYELLENETLNDLISHAGGLSYNASSNIIIDTIDPIKARSSDDNAMLSTNINLKNADTVFLGDGSYIDIKKIESVDTKLEIFGRVKSPGKYSANSSTLKDILDIAGGFNDPVFRKTIIDDQIIILRKNENKFYHDEFVVNYDQANTFEMKVNDKILVYENTNYRNSFTYQIEGEVGKPGTYPLRKGLTVGEAINLAGGLSNFSSFDNVVVMQEFSQINDLGSEEVVTQKVANLELDFQLGPNSIIKALPFENVVYVQGNVYNPGLVAYQRGLTMTQAIMQAGGYKPYSMKKRSYIISANGEIRKANLFRGRVKRLTAGDTIFVPANPNPSDFDITKFIADLSSTLANLAAIFIIIDNQD